MEEATNKNYPSTTEDLISAMENGEYKHLQIFLFRNEPKYGFGFNEKYLVVNHNGFALYKLTDLKYDNGNIIIAFINPETGENSTAILDINDAKADLIAINWQDVQEMVYSDQPDDGILEINRD